MLSISNEQHRPQGIHEITACTCNLPQHLYCPAELVYQNRVSPRWKYFLPVRFFLLSLRLPAPKLTTGWTNADFQFNLMWFSQGMWIGSVNTTDGSSSDFVDLYQVSLLGLILLNLPVAMMIGVRNTDRLYRFDLSMIAVVCNIQFYFWRIISA